MKLAKQVILLWCAIYIYLIEIEILDRDGILDLVNSFGIGASYRILEGSLDLLPTLDIDHLEVSYRTGDSRIQRMAGCGVRAEGWARRVAPHGSVFYSRAGVTRWFPLPSFPFSTGGLWKTAASFLFNLTECIPLLIAPLGGCLCESSGLKKL